LIDAICDEAIDPLLHLKIWQGAKLESTVARGFVNDLIAEHQRYLKRHLKRYLRRFLAIFLPTPLLNSRVDDAITDQTLNRSHTQLKTLPSQSLEGLSINA
jgi:hypothetical protein